MLVIAKMTVPIGCGAFVAAGLVLATQGMFGCFLYGKRERAGALAPASV
jgi:hypothetical protein